MKTKTVTFRLSDKDLELLRSQARGNDMTESEWLRHLIRMYEIERKIREAEGEHKE